MFEDGTMTDDKDDNRIQLIGIERYIKIMRGEEPLPKRYLIVGVPFPLEESNEDNNDNDKVS